MGNTKCMLSTVIYDAAMLVNGVFFPQSCWQWSYPVIHCQGRHIGKPEGTLWAMAEPISWRFKDNIPTFGLASECSAQILWVPGSNELARSWKGAVENRTAIPPNGGSCHPDAATFCHVQMQVQCCQILTCLQGMLEMLIFIGNVLLKKHSASHIQPFIKDWD